MDIINYANELAKTFGAPIIIVIIVAIGMFVFWLQNNRVSTLKEQNNFLQNKLDDAMNFKPDILATRLAERHKLLTSELETLSIDNEKNKIEISEKENELAKLHKDMSALSAELNKAHEALYGNFPRGGRISDVVVNFIIHTLQFSSKIITPIKIVSDHDEVEGNFLYRGPLKLGSEGCMGKELIDVIDNDNKIIGFVENLFMGNTIYNNDYMYTLSKFLSIYMIGPDYPEYLLPVEAEIFALPSLFDKNTREWFLVIPFSPEVIDIDFLQSLSNENFSENELEEEVEDLTN